MCLLASFRYNYWNVTVLNAVHKKVRPYPESKELIGDPQLTWVIFIIRELPVETENSNNIIPRLKKKS